MAADVLHYGNIYPGISAAALLLSSRFYLAAKLESLTALYILRGASLDKETSKTSKGRRSEARAREEKYAIEVVKMLGSFTNRSGGVKNKENDMRNSSNFNRS